MPSHVALLRGINVGGNYMVAMADLRELLESLGCTEVKTLLQSGNVVFTTKAAPAALTAKMEKAAAKAFGRPIDFFIRTAAEWHAIVAKNPFPKEAKADPAHLYVTCLKDKPDAKSVAALKSAITGPEYLETHGACLYLVYPEGSGRSKLTLTLIEKKLGTRGTSRNWNTTQKIAALLSKP